MLTHISVSTKNGIFFDKEYTDARSKTLNQRLHMPHDSSLGTFVDPHVYAALRRGYNEDQANRIQRRLTRVRRPGKITQRIVDRDLLNNGVRVRDPIQKHPEYDFE